MTVPVDFQFRIIEKDSDRVATMYLRVDMEPNTIPMPGHAVLVEHMFPPLIKDVVKDANGVTHFIKDGKYDGVLISMNNLEVDKFDDEIQNYLDAGFTCELHPLDSEFDTAAPV